MKIFITGSCGFLFSNFIRKSIHYKLGYKITSIDMIKSSHILNNVFQNKDHSFFIGSCSDKHLIDILFVSDKPDIVIHSATNNDSIEDSITQTISLLEKCKQHDVKRFIFISSDKVYGSNKEICFNECSLLNPITNIGISKSVSEKFVEQYCKLHKIDYNIVRVSNFFGPRQNKNNLMVDALHKLKNNKEVVLNSNNIGDWGYVVDAVNGLIKVIDSGRNNEIYNLARGEEMSELEIITKLCDKLQANKSLIKLNNASDYTRIIPTCHKLKSLGWEPEIKIDDGIHLFCEWYLNNNWWFNN